MPSQASAALVGEVLPPGAALRDLGVHRLKDLEGPERIRQLRAAGLQAEFPPLRTGAGGAAAATRALHRDLASFTGRQQELRELVDAAAGAAAAGGGVGIHAIGGIAREGLQEVIVPPEQAAVKRPADIASDEAVDRMIADAQEAAVALLDGPDGLIGQLTAKVIRRALGAEMTSGEGLGRIRAALSGGPAAVTAPPATALALCHFPGWCSTSLNASRPASRQADRPVVTR